MSKALRSVAAIVALVSVAIFGLAAFVTARERPNPRAATGDSVRLEPGAAEARTEDFGDPRGGPPWALQLGRTDDGRVCAQPGRRVGTDVGVVGRGGILRAKDMKGASCLDVDGLSGSEPVAWHISMERYNPITGQVAPVTLIWGHVAPEVAALAVRAGQQSVSTPLRHQTFLAVFDGDLLLSDVTFKVRYADGSTKSIAVPAPTPSQREFHANPPSTSAFPRPRATHATV